MQLSTIFTRPGIAAAIGILLIMIPGCGKDEKEGDRNSITVTDADGNIYHTITIGTQVWMVENLRTTKFSDSSPLPMDTGNADWDNLRSPGYCWYGNDSLGNSDSFGALYNWYAVNSGKLCPKGWHVPTDDEWSLMITYLGGDTVAGGKLKEAGYSHWPFPNTNANNSSGFTALPGGSRLSNGMYNALFIGGYWWSSTETLYSTALYMTMVNNSGTIFRSDYIKGCAFSVRCIKD